MAFNDDEPIVASSNSTGPVKRPKDGRVQLDDYHVKKAPLDRNNYQVLLELTGTMSTDRLGVDLVAVLDVSGSMKGDKLKKMKNALQFVMRKLSDVDRLSIVTFSDNGARLCPLRCTNEASEAGFKALIDGLAAGGWTNVSEGLQTGIKVLADRRLSDGRVASIMLMSDGQQNRGGDARSVQVGNVPVYTFGFGADHDPNLLRDIATTRLGATFYYVADQVELSGPFSQLLAGLLTVVAQDLKLTVVPRDPSDATITKADAGSAYNSSPGPDAGAFTVTFGDLYGREVRTVIVDLDLPHLAPDHEGDDVIIMEATFSYTYPGLRPRPPTKFVTVLRTGAANPDSKDPKLEAELARRQHATMIRAARIMADGEKLESARDKVVEGQNALENVIDQSNPMLDMLRAELYQLLKLMKTQKLYNEQGRAYALACETSHDCQRFAARGDVDAVRLFATPRMDTYLEQAKQFDKDPNMKLPTPEEDVKQEIIANPLSSIAGPLALYLQIAIQALQSIEKLIKADAA